MNFSIISGDLRNAKLAEMFLEEGHNVKVYGLPENSCKIENQSNLEGAISEADVVIGPTPCSNDGILVNCINPNYIIKIADLFKEITKNQIFIAGRIDEKILSSSDIFNVSCIDILTREEMAILNAIPSAEGAIQIAMEEMPITLHNSKVLVLGYGRIGKILSKMLHGIGAELFVEARKYSDIALINAMGYTAIHISKLLQYLDAFDLIINTIPAIILDSNELKQIRKDCLLIDLASKPGGINFQKATELGLKSIWALSLPGKVAPVTTAKFIKNTIYNILEELGL